MDYIIKEKSFVEQFLNCEIDNYITESKFMNVYKLFYNLYTLLDKGTFYIDDSLSFSRVLLLGNHLKIFVLELLFLLSLYLLTTNTLIAAAGACVLNMVS